MVNKEVEAYVLLLRKYFWRLVLATAIVLVAYFSVYFTNYHYYGSECSMIVNQDVMNIGATNYSFLNEDQIPTSTSENRLLYIFNSNALRDSLIYRMDLINHYNIKKTASFRYERALKKLTALVSLQKVDNNIYKIHVRDKERAMTAKLANEIPRLINVVAKDLMLKNLKAKVLKYQMLIDTLSRQNKQIEKTQFELLQQITPQELRVLEIQKNISGAINAFKGLTENNVHQIESYKFILANEKQMDLNAVTVLSNAYPDTNFGYDYIDAFLICFYTFFGVITLFILIVVFYNNNKYYIQLLFKGKTN